MYLKRKEKIQKVLTTSLINKNAPPNKKKKKSPILTLPLSTWLLLYPKLLPPFCHKWQRVSHWEVVISSSPEELEASSSSASLLSSSSSKASREGEGDSTKPLRRACRHAIWLTRAFTWYISVVSVSRKASIRWNCAMTASKVIPPTEVEGMDVDGAEEVEGVAVLVSGNFDRS